MLPNLTSCLIPTECVMKCLCFVCLATSFLLFHSDYTHSAALWIVEGLALVLGAPLRVEASLTAGVGAHEQGINDGLLDAALQMLVVFAVVLLLPV